MGSSRPGPTCTTRGDFIDSGTAGVILSPLPGPVCAETDTRGPEPLQRALSAFEAEAVNFARRFIPDHSLRQQYIAKVKQMSDAVLDDVRRGVISAEQGQSLANQLRNEILATTRGASSDVGRAWAEALKAQGRTLAELQERYATQLFRRSFETLSETERNRVFLAIIEASGRARPSVLATSTRLVRLSRGLLFGTAAIAVYQVSTAEDPGREAVKQGTVVGAGLAGGALAGAAATGLICGPGAPVCVGIIVFIGGGLAAVGADIGFDHFFR